MRLEVQTVYRLCGKGKIKAPALHFFLHRSPRSGPEPKRLKGGKLANGLSTIFESKTQISDRPEFGISFLNPYLDWRFSLLKK
jgi:hypothetical protein